MNTSPKQDFIGGLVAGTLVKVGVRSAIELALKKAAKRSDVALDKQDVPVVTAAVADAVEQEVQARVEHITDTEPNRSSRNVWGVLFGLMGEAAILYTYATDGVPQDFQAQIAPHLLVVIGLLTPLYSRFFAKKPLFR
jgi:hypothetical protein